MCVSSQAKYIAQCMEEIKQELRQDNINVKCNAVAKLTYVSVNMHVTSTVQIRGSVLFGFLLLL